MKHLLSKILAAVAALLVLLTLVVIGTVWVAADANTTTLIGFDEADALSKVNLGGMGNGTLSIVDYDGGKALQYADGSWGYPTITLNSKAQAGATAIALKVKAPVATGWDVLLHEQDVHGNTTEAYSLKANGTVTLVDANGAATQQTIANAINLFPSGFEGWVILTADSLTRNTSWGDNGNVLDFASVGKIEMHWETQNANIVDNIIGITDVDTFLTELGATGGNQGGNQGGNDGDDQQPGDNTGVLGTLIGFDEADALSRVVLNGMGNGNLSIVDYDGSKALQYAGGTWGYPEITLNKKPATGTTAIALKVKAAPGTTWNVMLSETDENGNVLEVYLLKANGTVTLVDANGIKTQQTIANAINLFPAGFEGWVIVTADSLTKHPGYSFVNNNAMDFNLLGKVMLQYETQGANIVDEIVAVADVDAFVAELGAVDGGNQGGNEGGNTGDGNILIGQDFEGPGADVMAEDASGSVWVDLNEDENGGHWVGMTTADPYQWGYYTTVLMNYAGADTTGATGLILDVSVPTDYVAGQMWCTRFYAYEGQGSGVEVWVPPTMTLTEAGVEQKEVFTYDEPVKVILINKETGKYQYIETTTGQIELPLGFVGTIIVPQNYFHRLHPGWGTDNNVIDMNKVDKILIENNYYTTYEPFGIDNLGLVKDIEAVLADLTEGDVMEGNDNIDDDNNGNDNNGDNDFTGGDDYGDGNVGGDGTDMDGNEDGDDLNTDAGIEDTESPDTGDTSVWAAIVLLLAAAAVTLAVSRKRHA